MTNFKRAKIQLTTPADVQDFCVSASKNIGDVTLSSGEFTVDGKSLLGIISLNLSQPVTVTVDSPVNDEFAEYVKKIEIND